MDYNDPNKNDQQNDQQNQGFNAGSTDNQPLSDQAAINPQPIATTDPAQPVSEPTPEPVAEPVPEPEPEPVVEPVPEPVAEPVSEPVPEPVPEPVSEPVSEPVAEPVTEPTPEPEQKFAQFGQVDATESSNQPQADTPTTMPTPPASVDQPGSSTPKSILVIILIIILVTVGYEMFLKSKMTNVFKGIEEANRPAQFTLTYLKDEDCLECFDIELFSTLIDEIDSQAEVIERVVPFNTDEGQELITKYEINKVPIVIIEGDLEKNDSLAEIFGLIGMIKDGAFVLEDIRPPYLDLETNQLVGKFSLIYLTDPECEECYDVSLHKNALENLQLKTVDEQMVDYRSEQGQQLVEAYQIKAVPTIIMQGDLEPFDFAQLWQNVGTIEEDGAYVYREMALMGKYMDLETNKIVGDEITP